MKTTPTRTIPMTRRGFVKSGVMGLTALSARRVLGANERINVGLIGFGLIGRFHLASFKEQPDARIAAVCDVHQGRLEAAAAMAGGDAARYGDFRKLLDSKDVDAVVVATPDHWHALMTMMACAAGKDVYVEKPLTLFVREGRWMLDVARRTKRVVQVGTQNRSGPPFQKARELIRQGQLGRTVCASVNNSRNVMPGFGNPPDGPPPPELDYDMFLGPAPKRPYNPNRSIYHFRWFWDRAQAGLGCRQGRSGGRRRGQRHAAASLSRAVGQGIAGAGSDLKAAPAPDSPVRKDGKALRLAEPVVVDPLLPTVGGAFRCFSTLFPDPDGVLSRILGARGLEVGRNFHALDAGRGHRRATSAATGLFFLLATMLRSRSQSGKWPGEPLPRH
jgi:hypothetical protein